MPKTKKQCEMIREETKKKIIDKAIFFFARNGFAGTKISDLAKSIGIAQGTMYQYFASKKALLDEIYKLINMDKESHDIHLLSIMPIKAEKKIRKLSSSIIDNLQKDIMYASKIALNTQMIMENSYESRTTTYNIDFYTYTKKIILDGQKEKSVIDGDASKLTDYYWSVVYLYALKKLFTTNYELINEDDLSRILLRDKVTKGE